MSKLTSIIRIKKNKPNYDLYQVIEGKLNYINTYEDLDQIDNNISSLKLILSLNLCTEGERQLPEKNKNIKIESSLFYFSHQIISEVNDLKFSKPILIGNKLRQIWLNKSDYKRLIEPVIIKFNNKIENIITEKFAFILPENNSLEFIDGKNISVLKSNKDGELELSYSSYSNNAIQERKGRDYEGLVLNNKNSGIPNFDVTKQKLNFKLYSILIIIFILLNVLLTYLSSNPYINLRVSHALNESKLLKIDNNEEIINAEKVISEKFENKIPNDLLKFDDFINKLPLNMLENLISLEFTIAEVLILKYNKKFLPEILSFLNNNSYLNGEIYEVNNNLLALSFNIENY